MSSFEVVALIVVGAFSGSINAIVGGGTLFCFPLLLALGIPPVTANATNTVALWPASLVAARAYIDELRNVRDKLLLRSIIAVLGGTVGATLLLASDDAVFYRLVPWLIAMATLLFALSKQIVRRLSVFSTRVNAGLVLVLELVFAVYGGYFGAGVGILLMAALAVGGEADPQIANAQKNLLSGLINGAAVAIFVFQGAVLWVYIWPTMAGAILGGYLGARAARLIPALWLSRCVVATGVILSVTYFRNVYLS